MATPEQIKTLQQISIDRYEDDGGIMYECFDRDELAELIDAQDGDVEAAWKYHMRITEARRESGGYYEKF